MKNLIWKTFSSVRLTIFLLITITLLAIIGTLIIQKDVEDMDKIKGKYSPAVFQFFDRLGLFAVYHSWWFRGAIFLLLLNLIVCSLNRLPNSWKLVMHPNIRIEEEDMAKLPLFHTIQIPSQLNEAEEKIQRALRKIARQIQIDKHNDRQIYYTQKHAFSRFGYVFTHFSLVVLLIGVFISSLFSIKGYIGLVEGEASNTIWFKSNEMTLELPFTVKVEKCWVEYYENRHQMEKDWFSKLTIMENGKPVLSKTIQVNDPLIYRGYHFFQHSFIPNAQSHLKQLFITINTRPDHVERYPVKVGDTFTYKPANLEIKVLQFLPDFVFDGKKAISRSEKLNNPAALLLITYPDGERKTIWLFSNFPDFHKSIEMSVHLGLEVEAEFKNWTGLMVTKDPGLWTVWLGCGLLSISLIISFYFVRRRYWVMISEDKEKKNVLLIGSKCDRSHSIIEKEFQFLVENIHKDIKA
jgi:cytochrome c biogenesis protein